MNWVHRRNLPESLPLNDIIVPIPQAYTSGLFWRNDESSRFVISMLTGIVVTYAVLLLGCLFIDKTLPTVDVVILSLVVGASAQQLSRVLMSINRTFPYLACSQRI
ncbi:Uncharacterised protein [Escherichia coli]|nr:Uncharacterised protein [Escherichia coli]